MPPIPCTLHCASDAPHLQQIYTGFAELARRGQITLTQRLRPVAQPRAVLLPELRDHGMSLLEATVDGVPVAFDVHDSGHVDGEVLARVEHYFKRSWEAPLLARVAGAERVHPLGLNVWVHDEPVDFPALRRARLHRGLDRFKSVVRALGADRLTGDALYTPRQRDLEAEPPITLAPRVLFLAEAWDPDQAYTAAGAAERRQMNTTRASCMRALRDAFGDRVTCGFRPSAYVQREFADLAMSRQRATCKRVYLEQVRAHAICVATTGLQHSVGWKLAEYVSMSRAIVSQRLHMRLPGRFDAGVHYLAFETPQQCVEQVGRLLDDAALRAAMMQANARYHREHLAPAALVAAALDVVRRARTSARAAA